MPIHKPSFPQLSTTDLNKKLDTLESAVASAKQADGSVDLKQVSRALGDDEGLRNGLQQIKDSFQRTESRTYSGCGGDVTRDVDVDPVTLTAGEVQSVVQALLVAQRIVAAMDSNADGVLQRGEAESADGGSGLAGRIAEGLVEGAVDPFQRELNQWRTTISEALDTVEGRKDLDDRMSRTARKHAATDLGSDAILWAYREIVSSGRGVDVWHMDDTLADAERSFLRHLPFFGDGLAGGAGHLSNDEVKEFLGTSDLLGFVREKQASVRDMVGDYKADFLEGADLAEEISQASDPDFSRVSTSGC
jgi:hypothetical protein